jgi:tetratricopeptide (TPR) repeat protein
VYGSFVQSKMFRNDVRCGDCHDVHSLELVADGNQLCLQCHQAEVYDSYDHHFHKREHEGRPSEGHLCVKCHMPERPYMVVDWRADHSLRVPRPDLSQAIGVPNACNQAGCHDDKPVSWSVEHHRDWYGRARKPHYGTILAAGRGREPGAQDQLITLAGNELYPAIVRATALSLLAAYPGPESAAAFDRALADDEALVRYTALSNLNPASIERMVEQSAPLLFDPVRGVRMQAAAQLAGVPDELLKPYQRQALTERVGEYIETMKYSLDFAFAGHNLGNLYTKLNQPDKAAEYYDAAVEIDDLFYPAKVNLAMLHNSQGRNEEAERLLREVIEDYPQEYEVAYSLALLLVEMGRPGEAVAFLETAAQGMPGRSRVWYNLGLLRQRTGSFPGAEAALLRALELEPDNLDYLYALADHYIKRGYFSKARPIADRMIAADPDHPAARNLKSYIDNQLRQ